VRSSKQPRLPRVLIAALGTGRYRSLAIEALETANQKFGGDCTVLVLECLCTMDSATNHTVLYTLSCFGAKGTWI
jgi:hypothetical protein